MLAMTKSRKIDQLKTRFKEGSRLTIERICLDFGVTRRTANRYLEELKDMDLELRYETLSNGQRQWYAALRSRKIYVSYSIRDVLALFLGRSMFDFLANTSLEDGIGRVYSRIETQLSREKDLANAKKLSQKVCLIHEGPKKLPKKASEILDECLSGLLHEKKIRIWYVNHRGVESKFTLHPYTLVAYKRGLYIVGLVEENGRVTTYSLERIKSAHYLKEASFDYPADHDPEKIFKEALFIVPGKPVPVEIVFTKSTRPFIRIRKFHQTQRLKDLPDGRIRMTLKVPINFETVNWVLSFGANAEVVSPPELKAMVKGELEKAIAIYR